MGRVRIHEPALWCWPTGFLKEAAFSVLGALEINLVRIPICLFVTLRTSGFLRDSYWLWSRMVLRPQARVK